MLKEPINFIFFIITKKVPEKVKLITPIGVINVSIRNYESLKTIFSIFCREDYIIENNKTFLFMDVGSNCGYSAIYFLTRNNLNKVICYEPDDRNIKYLNINLSAFKERVKIKEIGVGINAGSAKFFITKDGKYNSLNPILNNIEKIINIRIVRFKDEIENLRNSNNDLIIKLDVEGLEETLIKSIDCNNYIFLKKLIIESSSCSKIIEASHKRKVVNGYVEHLEFIKN